MNPRCWLLAVVSAESQAETLPHQRAWAERICKERGWTLDPSGIYSDNSTGRHGTRRLVHDLIADLRRLPKVKRPGRVLMVRLDRIGRGDDGGLDALGSFRILSRELGVTVHTRDDGDVSLQRATDALLPSMKLLAASLENEARRDRATAVYARKRAAGLAVGNRRAYGLTLGPGGRDVAQLPQAEAVRRAFIMRASGGSYYAIGKELADTAPPAIYKKAPDKPKPVRWTSNRVRSLLSNRAYVGVPLPTKDDPSRVIVDEVTFERAQRAKEQVGARVASGRARHPWPLAGALRCYCGLRMYGQATGKGQRFRYYTCRATWTHAGSFRMVRAEGIEEQFVTLLGRLRADPELIATYRKSSASASTDLLERTLREAKEQARGIEREVERVWTMNAKGVVADEYVQPRLEALGKQRAELARQVERLEREIALATASAQDAVDVAKVVAEAARRWKRATADAQSAFARALAVRFEGFTVEQDGTLAVRRAVDPGAQRRLRGRR